MAQPFQSIRAGGGVDPHEHKSRHGDASDSRSDRDRCRAGIPQCASHELFFKFKPDDEEEDRQQPVRRPFLHAEVKMESSRAEGVIPNRLIEAGSRRVGQQKRSHRRGQQQDTSHDVVLQRMVNSAPQFMGSSERGGRRLVEAAWRGGGHHDSSWAAIVDDDGLVTAYLRLSGNML